MSLFRNSRGIAIPNTNFVKLQASPLRVYSVFMGRERKERKVLLDSVKIENRWKQALKIPQGDKTSPVTQTKNSSSHFARPTPLGSFLVHASENHKQHFPRLILGNPD